MKKTMYMIACLCFVWSVRAVDITAISGAIRSGDAQRLTACMDSEADLAAPGVSVRADGQEVVAQLARFFEANKVTAFTVAHQADKKETGFVVGKLTTETGDFRVNITYSIKEEQVLIQSIRIE
ncbi:MAG: DUF4783 domain-containing protein [Tannerella sp.]|nr:DUF4783 domain-containing protein [Tannerella sp.]